MLKFNSSLPKWPVETKQKKIEAAPIFQSRLEGFSFLTSKRKKRSSDRPSVAGKKNATDSLPKTNKKQQRRLEVSNFLYIYSVCTCCFQSCHNPTTLRVQLQVLRADDSVPGDLLGRCPLPSCRPGHLQRRRKDGGWDHDEKGGENHTNHTETRVNIWFNKITKGNLCTSGEIVPLHTIFLAVKSVRSAETAKTNSKRTFLESLHASLLLCTAFARQRHSFEQLYLLHLSGSSGSSVLTFRDPKTASSRACFMVFE